MPKPSPHSNSILFFIIVLSGIFAAAVTMLPFKAKPLGDMTFHAEAKTMAAYIKGSAPYSQVMITKAPGPILFYTPPYLLAGVDDPDSVFWLYGVIFTSIIVTLALVLIYKASASFFGERVGLLSILLAFVFPIHCYYSLGILAEAPAFFATALAVFGWSRVVANPSGNKGWIWFTVGAWLLIMNRPNALLLPVLGLLVLAFAYFRHKDFFSRFGRGTFVSILAILASGFGSLQLVKTITGDKSEVDQSMYFYYVAHQGRYEFREEPFDFRFWENTIRPDSKDYQEWKRHGHELNRQALQQNVPRNELYREFLVKDFFEHPWLFTRSFAMKCIYGNLYFINSVRPEKFRLGPFQGTTGYWLLMALVNLVNVFIIFGAVLFLVRQKGLIFYWPLWGCIVALLVFHGITYMEPRYVFPSRAALYMMSAAGLYRLAFVRRLTDRLARRLQLSDAKTPA